MITQSTGSSEGTAGSAPRLPCRALVTDMDEVLGLTAGNDYSFNHIFSRQVRGLDHAGDFADGQAVHVVAHADQQQVHHRHGRELRRVPERQPEDRTHLVLELRGARALDRVVSAVVRTWGGLVHEQFAALRQEHFHRIDARFGKSTGHAQRQLLRTIRQ